MGFGIDSEYSRSRIPSPPQNSTTFISNSYYRGDEALTVGSTAIALFILAPAWELCDIRDKRLWLVSVAPAANCDPVLKSPLRPVANGY
jgi:hypothetical protein